MNNQSRSSSDTSSNPPSPGGNNEARALDIDAFNANIDDQTGDSSIPRTAPSISVSTSDVDPSHDNPLIPLKNVGELSTDHAPQVEENQTPLEDCGSSRSTNFDVQTVLVKSEIDELPCSSRPTKVKANRLSICGKEGEDSECSDDDSIEGRESSLLPPPPSPPQPVDLNCLNKSRKRTIKSRPSRLPKRLACMHADTRTLIRHQRNQKLITSGPESMNLHACRSRRYPPSKAKITEIHFMTQSVSVVLSDSTFKGAVPFIFIDMLEEIECAAVLSIEGQSMAIQSQVINDKWGEFLKNVNELEITGFINGNLLMLILRNAKAVTKLSLIPDVFSEFLLPEFIRETSAHLVKAVFEIPSISAGFSRDIFTVINYQSLSRSLRKIKIKTRGLPTESDMKLIMKDIDAVFTPEATIKILTDYPKEDRLIYSVVSGFKSVTQSNNPQMEYYQFIRQSPGLPIVIIGFKNKLVKK